MSSALILVDLEREWTDPKSEYFIGDISDVLDRTNRLIEFARSSKFPVVFIRHIEEDPQGPFGEGSNNIELLPELHVDDADAVIDKSTIGAFESDGFEMELKNIDHLYIAGIMTNLCVRKLVEDAYDKKYSITVVEDCCVSNDKKTHESTLRDLKQTRPEIEIVTLEELLNR